MARLSRTPCESRWKGIYKMRSVLTGYYLNNALRPNFNPISHLEASKSHDPKQVHIDNNIKSADIEYHGKQRCSARNVNHTSKQFKHFAGNRHWLKVIIVLESWNREVHERTKRIKRNRNKQTKSNNVKIINLYHNANKHVACLKYGTHDISFYSD